VGVSGWLDAARRQAAAMAFLESPLDKASFLAAVAVAVFASRGGKLPWWSLVWAGCITFFATVFTSVVLLGVIALVRLCSWAMALPSTHREDAAANRVAIPGLLVTIWFGALFLMTPLYTP